MNTSYNKYDTIENLIFNEGLRIKSVGFDSNHSKMLVHLTNGVTIIIPTKIYENLKRAPAKYLDNFKLTANSTGIHWPDLDEDLSLKGFFNELLKQLINQKKELIIS
jgi:hypothetical protein